MLTIQEASRLSKKTELTIRRLIKSKKLKAQKIKGIWQVDQSSFEQLFKQETISDHSTDNQLLLDRIAFLEQQIAVKDKQIAELHIMLNRRLIEPVAPTGLLKGLLQRFVK